MTAGARRSLTTSIGALVAFATLSIVFAQVSFAQVSFAPAPTPPTPAAAAPAIAARADSTAPPDTTVQVEFPHPDSTLAPRLREGGYILVFRHSITDWGQKDSDIENFEDRSTQRNLSKEGEEQATAIGKAIRALDVPILAVLSSPMWRCRDTARLAFGQEQTSIELFRRGPEYRAARIILMSTELDDPQNLVLVTHQDLLIPIIDGLRRDQLKEGDCFVIKPLGETKFEVVAQVTPDDWARLAGMPTAPKSAKAPESSKPTKK